jgi:hypothetical protein
MFTPDIRIYMYVVICCLPYICAERNPQSRETLNNNVHSNWHPSQAKRSHGWVDWWRGFGFEQGIIICVADAKKPKRTKKREELVTFPSYTLKWMSDLDTLSKMRLHLGSAFPHMSWRDVYSVGWADFLMLWRIFGSGTLGRITHKTEDQKAKWLIRPNFSGNKKNKYKLCGVMSFGLS